MFSVIGRGFASNAEIQPLRKHVIVSCSAVQRTCRARHRSAVNERTHVQGYPLWTGQNVYTAAGWQTQVDAHGLSIFLTICILRHTELLIAELLSLDRLEAH